MQKNCTFCNLIPKVLTPDHGVTLSDTKKEIVIELEQAERCLISLPSQNNLEMNRQGADQFSYSPTGTWELDQNISFTARCYNLNDLQTAKISKPVSASFTIHLPAPTVIHPPNTFKATSFHIYLKTENRSFAAEYEFELSRNGTVFTIVSASQNEKLIEIPADEAVFGNFSVRARYLDVNGVHSNWSEANEFSVIDRNAEVTEYSEDYSALSPCGELTTLLVAGCQGINIFSPPPNCNFRHWYGAAGNVWMCRPNGDSNVRLKLNNSGLNTLAHINAYYSDADITHLSMEFTGMLMNGNAQNEALLAVCRHYPSEGNESYAMVYYPRRTTGTNPNIEIRRKEYQSGNFEVLASAWRPNTNGSTVYRLDCIGNDITAYFRNSENKFVPLLSARDTRMPRTPHRFGFAIGQEGELVRMRVHDLNVRRISVD